MAAAPSRALGMSLEERYAYAKADIAGYGPVTGLMQFGSGVVIFWARRMESWGYGRMSPAYRGLKS